MAFAARRARGKYPSLQVNLGLADFPATLSSHPDPVARGEGSATERPPLSSGEPASDDFTTQLGKTRNGPKASPSPGGEGRGEGEPIHKILLVSHVLTELTPEQTEALMGLAVRAQCVLWVEPGTHEVSRRLIAIRERLRERFNVIAPCTHSASCGMLAPGNQRHWCHHFATPPREIFTDGNWSRFARLTGIDLRDLPLSFLVLDQRPAPPAPPGAGRVIGHPRIYKAHALLLGCDATGVREHKLQQRTLPAEFRTLKKSAGDVLGVWDWAGEEILATKRLPKS